VVRGEGAHVLTHDTNRVVVSAIVPPDRRFRTIGADAPCYAGEIVQSAPTVQLHCAAVGYEGKNHDFGRTWIDYVRADRPFVCHLNPLPKPFLTNNGGIRDFGAVPSEFRSEFVHALFQSVTAVPDSISPRTFRQLATRVNVREGLLAREILRQVTRPDCESYCATDVYLQDVNPNLRTWLVSQRGAIRDEDVRLRIQNELEKDSTGQTDRAALSVLYDVSPATTLPDKADDQHWANFASEIQVKGRFTDFKPAEMKKAINLVRETADAIPSP
jgi:hypothetical protein